MINYKTPAEIKQLRQAGKILAQILKNLAAMTAPGISTLDLEKRALELMTKYKVKPLFKGHQGFPAATCISVNEEIVHGIPRSDKILQTGDIVGIDTGLWQGKLCVDSAVTVPVGMVDPEALKLMEVTKECLRLGIAAAQVGNHIGDIGQAILSQAELAGLAVVRVLVGHGVGYSLWEEPQVPNFGQAGEGLELKPGLVIAIEPMLTRGGHYIKTLADGWTIVTADGSLAAQFEHTIAVTADGPLILTSL